MCLLVAATFSGRCHATTVINCTTGGTISAAIAAAKPANGYVEFKIKGACSDNVYVPPNQAIILVGETGASISPANANNATLASEGKLEVENLTISSGNYTALQANQGGFVTLIAGKITGPGSGLQVLDNAGALVQNASIAVTGSVAVNMFAGATLEIDGVSTLFGATGTSITGATTGVLCSQGSVTLQALSGPVSISNNTRIGLESFGCNVKTYANSGNAITLGNNGPASGYGAAIEETGGTVALQAGVSITNNPFYGVVVLEGASLQVNGITLTGNGSSAISSSQNSVVHIVNYHGVVNTISEPSGDTAPLFGCYQGGKIYVDQIAGIISPAPTTANQGCLTVGGP